MLANAQTEVCTEVFTLAGWGSREEILQRLVDLQLNVKHYNLENCLSLAEKAFSRGWLGFFERARAVNP